MRLWQGDAPQASGTECTDIPTLTMLRPQPGHENGSAVIIFPGGAYVHLASILEGRDVIAQAKTGSGKTAAFGLGLLQQLDLTQIRLQALVLCPTRELADQVSKAIRRLAVNLPNVKLLTLCGGMPLGPQLASLDSTSCISAPPRRATASARVLPLRMTSFSTGL